MRAYLPIIGGTALIVIGGVFLLLDRMDQTMWRFLPAFAAILIGAAVIVWKMPR
jgi:hypothetical protein